MGRVSFCQPRKPKTTTTPGRLISPAQTTEFELGHEIRRDPLDAAPIRVRIDRTGSARSRRWSPEPLPLFRRVPAMGVFGPGARPWARVAILGRGGATGATWANVTRRVAFSRWPPTARLVVCADCWRLRRQGDLARTHCFELSILAVRKCFGGCLKVFTHSIQTLRNELEEPEKVGAVPVLLRKAEADGRVRRAISLLGEDEQGRPRSADHRGMQAAQNRP